MSTLTAETPTETITTIPAPAAATQSSTPGGPGPATGAEYLLTGSYAKLSRGLKRRLLTRRPHHEAGAALAQAIHRAKPYTAGTKTDEGFTRAKTISRYTADGLQVLIDDARYDITLRRAGTQTVLVIGNLSS